MLEMRRYPAVIKMKTLAEFPPPSRVTIASELNVRYVVKEYTPDLKIAESREEAIGIEAREDRSA